MKANELRIGNWVKVIKQNASIKDFDAQIQCADITRIFDKSFNVWDYKPIPLTEEWLIKFGFINDKEIGYRWYLECEGCVILAYDLDDKCIRVSDTWQFGKREYAHQLQNLYFVLTGKELKINE